jgi:hypothetical protein
MMMMIFAIFLTLLACQLRPAVVERWINANRQLTVAVLSVAAAAAGVLLLATDGTSETAITPALLQRAAHAAEADGGGYDYTCQLYGAPRQILCQGQGATVTFLVSPAGRLQPEAGTG